LLDAIVPPFERATGVHVKRLPLSTAKALEYANLAGVDVVLLPAGAAFDKLAGPPPTYPPYRKELYPTPTAGTEPGPPDPPQPPGYIFNERRLVLWSELVLVGPPGDPRRPKQRND